MPSVVQRSFAGGVIAPALYGRADQVKYQTGLRECRNFIVQRYGGVTNRTGTQFITEVKTSADDAALLTFDFGSSDSYILEFGEQYIRFIKQAAQLEVSGLATWLVGTTYALADLVVHLGINYYSLQDANIGNTPASSPLFWYPLTGDVYEIPTPYANADVVDIKFSQLGDIVTLTHRDYHPHELQRFADLEWKLIRSEERTEIARPTGLATAGGPGGAEVRDYRVTAIAVGTNEESLPGTNATVRTITGITQANPAVVTTSVAHGFIAGDEVLVLDIAGMIDLNLRTFLVGAITATTLELVNEDSTTYPAYVSGGTVALIQVERISGTPTSGNPIVISWTAVPGAREYFIYKLSGTLWGFIGSARTASFNDTDITSNTAISHPLDTHPFHSTGDFPATSTYFQQRQAFANTINDPERLWMSRVGLFHNFTTSQPSDDADSINFVVAARKVGQIRHLIEISSLLIMASGAEIALPGGVPVTPTTFNAQTQTYKGSGSVAPVTIGNNLLYVQDRGKIVRDFRFQFEADGFQGQDLTVFVPHLFAGAEGSVRRWSYQQNPHSVLWTVLKNGDLIALTYVPEHEVWGWHTHDSGGEADKFIDVAVIPELVSIPAEGISVEEDFAYFIVERLIDGSTVKYIERMPSRDLGNQIAHMKFSDSHLSYDGRHLTLAGYNLTATATLTTGAGWTVDDDLTITLSAATLLGTSADEGNGFILKIDDSGGDEVRVFVTITTFGTSTTATVRPSKTVPTELRTVAVTDWTYAVDELAGLDHLEAETVAILADGSVETPLVVSSGSITLPRPYGVIHVGLPMTAQMTTLDLEIVGRETLVDKNKRVNKVSLIVEDTRGVFAGPDETRLIEQKERQDEEYDEPVSLKTGTIDIILDTEWNQHGRTVVQQADPLPITVLAIIPSGIVGVG